MAHSKLAKDKEHAGRQTPGHDDFDWNSFMWRALDESQEALYYCESVKALVPYEKGQPRPKAPVMGTYLTAPAAAQAQAPADARDQAPAAAADQEPAAAPQEPGSSARNKITARVWLHSAPPSMGNHPRLSWSA